MKLKIFKYKSVKSTNEIAIELIKNKKQSSGCIQSIKQTKGRGTYGKKWVSKKGNLFVTIFFPLEKNMPPFSDFFIINAVLLRGVIKLFCKNKKVSVKWPNDIFVNGKKICGILQEHITLHSKNFLIIGIGVNIISSPNLKNKYKATNIFSETKIKPTPNEIFKLILSAYKKFFRNISSYNYVNFKKKADLMVSN
jgi:BirA family biotin operon repressor/biotin-[acetyl-CoA-carboxylase] ligase